MKLARLLAGVTVLAVIAVSPASATHGGIHPTFREESVYFHCNGPTKVHQVNWTLAVAGSGGTSSYPTWDTTAPAQSVEEGAGCGALDWGGTTNQVYSAVFHGPVTGNLRDLTVRVHNLLLGNARGSEVETLRLGGDIDGVPIFPPGAQPDNGRTVTVEPVPSETGASEMFEFTITNLGYAIDVLDEEGNVVDVDTGGLALENGDGAQEHWLTLYVGVHGTGLSQDPQGHKVSALVWDTTEVPSGITFNPPDPAKAQVAADLPPF